MAKNFLFLFLLLTALCSQGQSTDSIIEKCFREAGMTGGFVMYDLNNNRYTRYNPQRCSERLLPASTFKIFNSLVGLETGVIKDENFVIRWDGVKRSRETWNQDQTLKTAFQYSAVWYYQELARRVGLDTMNAWIKKVGYGNGQIGKQVDNFWLEGPLAISPDEQIEFLKRLYQNKLPFSMRTMEKVKQIMVAEKTDAYTFSGKTGSAFNPVVIGWYVGYVERGGNVYFFATSTSHPTGQGFPQLNIDLTRRILKGLKVLP